ncbi:MAG TPA: hypothetical protein VL403_18040 [Candidatus Kryptonia bacterium]|nr:hypothetical protein [Candidatus Kryptonia bacterium]
MKSHAYRRTILLCVIAGVSAIGWWRCPAAATTTDLPAGGIPRIHDDGQKFVAFYGRLNKPLSLAETWRALRGMRVQLAKLDARRAVAGIVYYAGEDMYLAAVDFTANEVFIDRIGSRHAFTFIWHQVDADFSPGWSLRAPDRIESTDPGQGA